jgi:hypothetical protein
MDKLEFVVDLEEPRTYPEPVLLTGWETIRFALEDEDQPPLSALSTAASAP